MTRQFWSEEEKKLLEKLWVRNDLQVDDIAKVFKSRTTIAVMQEAKRLGLPMRGDIEGDRIDYEYLKKLGVVIEG